MTAPDNHLDLDAAAALDEGLDVDDGLRAHAASCEECGRRLAAVRTTRALLSALPDEEMPQAVADRVHEALPREPVFTTIVPTGSRRRRWTSSPALAGMIAAAAALALVAAISIGSLRSGNHNNGGAGGEAGGAATLPQVASANFPVVASGAKYTNANAQALVGALDELARTPHSYAANGTTSAQTRSAPQKDSLTPATEAKVPRSLRALFNDRQRLLACARLVAGGPVTPLAVDFARFTGGLRKVHDAPAIVILLPAFGGLRDSAFIVGPRCDTDPSQDLYAFQAAPAR